MKTTKRLLNHSLAASMMLVAGIAMAQGKPPGDAIDGVKGVKQEAVKSIKNIAPPTIVPVTPPPPAGVTQPVPPPPPAGVKQPAPAPPPPAAQGVNKVDGIQTAPPNTVKSVPPPPATAISTIRAVQGVQGIIAPKQLNLEAALLIKEDAKGAPAGGGAEGGKGISAAAALLNGPAGLVPAPPVPNGDGRAGFQEFEKLTAPGS
jgi:hypothetical protein